MPRDGGGERRDSVRAQAGYGGSAIGIAVTALAHEADQQADAERGQETFVRGWQMEAGFGQRSITRTSTSPSRALWW